MKTILKIKSNGNVIVVKFNREWEEYQVTKNHDEGSTYFTDDRIDATETAKAMARN